MLGNVWEWCWDGYGDYAPPYTDPLGNDGSPFRIARGGGWGLDSEAVGVRAAVRYGNDPSAMVDFFGFRPARSVP